MVKYCYWQLIGIDIDDPEEVLLWKSHSWMACDLINGLRVDEIFKFLEKIENMLSSSPVDSSVHEHREPVAENQV